MPLKADNQPRLALSGIHTGRKSVWIRAICVIRVVQEGKKINKHLKENKTQCMFIGLKSHCMGLLPCKEKRKCVIAKYRAEFLNIGSHSPKQYVNQRWPQ
ncbi:MAG: hypothetical protein J5U19_16075 [Candidatus Methanoperedens sp.]|nr:hypothetical protein [Candidatus Methanoperedens sp.]